MADKGINFQAFNQAQLKMKLANPHTDLPSPRVRQ